MRWRDEVEEGRADWIDGMTTRFRSSGFPRRYFRDSRELVNSPMFAARQNACSKRRNKPADKRSQPSTHPCNVIILFFSVLSRSPPLSSC